MLSTARLYLDTMLAVAIMAALGVIAGFAAAAITGDRAIVIGTISTVFVLTGAVIVFRFWRMTKTPEPPLGPGI